MSIDLDSELPRIADAAVWREDETGSHRAWCKESWPHIVRGSLGIARLSPFSLIFALRLPESHDNYLPTMKCFADLFLAKVVLRSAVSWPSGGQDNQDTVKNCWRTLLNLLSISHVPPTPHLPAYQRPAPPKLLCDMTPHEWQCLH